jgi:glycosyltransferase involved in cell wall biosynthesis
VTILFGHPTGNPNSHHAALAHYESGRLEAFCVPWMPSRGTLRMLEGIPRLRGVAQRLARRRFAPLDHAPRIQGRTAEWMRMLRRAAGGDEALSYEANDWLMRTMASECGRPSVTAVHAYEDCSELQFRQAKRSDKACIYDLPIGYWPAWERTREHLLARFGDWLPPGGLPSSRHARPAQKLAEMTLADVVLVPSAFVEATVLDAMPGKRVARAPYGVDASFWRTDVVHHADGPMRFICAGQLSLRKGVPLLLQAWRAAALVDAELHLVGNWQLAPQQRASLPQNVRCFPACSREQLREHFRHADVFVLASFFEGLALVVLEAMACGLPAIASHATGADAEMLAGGAGMTIPTGDLDACVAALRWMAASRPRLPQMSAAARANAAARDWRRYRRHVDEAVAAFA